jgi:D-alanyl-D-alanine carboxypeptidase
VLSGGVNRVVACALARCGVIAAVLLAPLVTGCGDASQPGSATASATAERLAAPSPRASPIVRRRRDAPRIAPGPARTATRFNFQAVRLTPALRQQLSRTSWHPGCPVSLDQLRYLRISYWGFDHRAHLGEMVVNASAVAALSIAFADLFTARFPIRRMRLVDRYGGSDYASIQADNTSAFNCRDATGSTHWSEHAYGLAIDINPIENPYVYGNGTTTHRASEPYLDRADVRPGMAVLGGTLVRAFTAIGWGWGGRWPPPTDYQHFSVNGR